jgi:hypothetical protein
MEQSFITWQDGTILAHLVFLHCVALLKQQGLNVRGILKNNSTEVEAPVLMDSSGKLEVSFIAQRLRFVTQ